MTNEDSPPYCPRCGERAGMYEAISVVDGAERAVTPDDVLSDPVRNASWVFHDACLASAR
jgi:hypothetical protein